MGSKSRTERPGKIEIGTEVVHVTVDSEAAFKFKRSKVNLQGIRGFCGGLPNSLLEFFFHTLYRFRRTFAAYIGVTNSCVQNGLVGKYVVSTEE